MLFDMASSFPLKWMGNVFTPQTVAVCLLVFLVALYFFRRPKSLPPGPWFVIPGKEPHITLTALAQKYGSIYSIRLGAIFTAVVINDAESFRDVLVTNGDQFVDRNIPPLIRKIAPIEGSFVFEGGEFYKERRRFGLGAFRNFGVGKKSLQSRINEEARHLCNLLDQQDADAINPTRFISNAVANIICTISFGNRFDYTDPIFNDLLARMRENASFITFTSLANFFPFLYRTSYYAKHRENVAKIKTFIEDIIDEHRKTFDRSDLRDVIDMYIDEIMRQREQHSNVVFSDGSMWRSIYDLFGAGSDTTTNTLLWGLLFLCYDPPIQTKIQDELDSVVGFERAPSMGDRDSLPFTSATISEILRIRPVAPLAMRGANCDVNVMGYTIPKGSTVIPNIWAVHHDPKQWKDPDQFNPSRFLSDDGKTCIKHPALVPFGAGRRSCLGRQLAEMELFLFLANMMQRFTFSFPVDQQNPDMQGKLGFSHNPTPFKICITKR